jgi:Cysteine-rich secretory protein family
MMRCHLKLCALWLLALAFALALDGPATAQARVPQLGDAPSAPADISTLPTGGPRKESVTGSFTVNINSREQVRSFFNAVYNASVGISMDSTAVISNCVPGSNSFPYYNGVLLRINWYRAMAGVPAIESFNTNNCIDDQEAALMMSANTNLSHYPPPTWNCFTANGAHAASNSDLALGFAGPDAINSFMQDFGTPNYPVGHRRWILYPQTQIMGTGDVPVQGSYMEANATWVLDGNYDGPRPATRTPYVSWPPPGYAPYPVVFPRWSFAYPNANFSNASVTMTSNGVPISVTLETYDPNSYGENTLVWVPMGLDAGNFSTTWPFSGADTVYSVTISNITGASSNTYSYTVTVFDPGIPGADYFPPTIHGTNLVTIGQTNKYTFTPVTNANSYQWLLSTVMPLNFFDGAEDGLTNFMADVSPDYAVITNNVVESGNEAFHLAMPTATDQILTLNRTLMPNTNTVLTFGSLFALATSNQIAEVQASTDGVSWTNLFSQAGDSTWGQSDYTNIEISLADFAGENLFLRFDYAYESGSYYTNIDFGLTGYYAGWYLDNIGITNCQELVDPVTNSIPATNFVLTVTNAGIYVLQARALSFGGFPLAWGPLEIVTAVLPPPIIIALNQPVLTGPQVRLDFALQSGSATTFQLLSAPLPNGPWTTNAQANLITNIPGSSYSFMASTNGSSQFYRVQTP